MIHIRDTFEALCQKVPLDNPLAWSRAIAVDFDGMSMEDFARHYGGKETALRTVTVWTKAMLGLEPREVSALYFLAYCKAGGGIMQMRSDERNGGQFLRLTEGEWRLDVTSAPSSTDNAYRNSVILQEDSFNPPTRLHPPQHRRSKH